MEYKEKYKNVMEVLKKAASDPECEDERFCCVVYGLFPELKESEDEKIRETLIENFKWFCGDFPETTKWGKDDNLLVKDILAWLEKQGEPTDINPSEFDLRLNRLLKQFESMPKEELANSLSFYLNVVQNDGTYKADKKQGEQKPAWSEEDMFKVQRICEYLDEAKKYYADITEVRDCVDWLKSLKNKVQPQPKQEWSEDDEMMVENILGTYKTLEDMLDLSKRQDQDILESMNFERGWLKSLKQKIGG